MHKDIDSIPSYPSLPSKLICVLLSVTLHVWFETQLVNLLFVFVIHFVINIISYYVFNQADGETDEVYAQMTLQPVNKVGQTSHVHLI